MDTYLIESAAGAVLALSARKIKEMQLDPETGEVVTRESPTIVKVKKVDLSQDDTEDTDQDMDVDDVDDVMDVDDDDEDSDFELSDEEKEELKKLLNDEDVDIEEAKKMITFSDQEIQELKEIMSEEDNEENVDFFEVELEI